MSTKPIFGPPPSHSKFDPRSAIIEALESDAKQPSKPQPTLGELKENDYYVEAKTAVNVAFPFDAERPSKIRVDYTIEIHKRTWGISGASLTIKETDAEVSYTLVNGEKEVEKTIKVNPGKLRIESVGEGSIPLRVGDVQLDVTEDGEVDYAKSYVEVMY